MSNLGDAIFRKSAKTFAELRELKDRMDSPEAWAAIDRMKREKSEAALRRAAFDALEARARFNKPGKRKLFELAEEQRRANPSSLSEDLLAKRNAALAILARKEK